MKAEELWQKAVEELKIKDQEMQVWIFHKEEAKLIARPSRRLKTYPEALINAGKETRAEAGQYKVIVDEDGEAYCLISIDKVEVFPFVKIRVSHSFLECIGDKLLGTWRNVKGPIFEKELKEIGQTFDNETPVVVEQFRLAYKQD